MDEIINSIKNVIENQKKINPIPNQNQNGSLIIPFGKYKGQPVEVLGSDPDYVTYLNKDNWLKEKHPKIYQTIIINNFQETSETPEHNSLQVLFLDDEYCNKFLIIFQPKWKEVGNEAIANYIKQEIQNTNKDIIEAKKGLERYPSEEYYRNNLKNYEEYSKKLNNISYLDWKLNSSKEFESKGVDVKLNFHINLDKIDLQPFADYEHGYFEIAKKIPNNQYNFSRLETLNEEYEEERTKIYIELKPQVGDDYPGVLRQMKLNNSNVLFLKSYTGQGATLSQFIKTFELSGIRVIFKHEVDEVKLENN